MRRLLNWYSTHMYKGRTLVAIGIAAALLSALVIYLTPLKWINLVEPPIHDITSAEFYADFEKNPDNYIFIDVRNESAYNTAHAKGSISKPIGSLFDGHRFLPKSGKQIVLICSSSRLAGVAYGYLEHQGFFNLLRIKGGVQAWVVAGLPLEGSNIHAPIPEVD